MDPAFVHEMACGLVVGLNGDGVSELCYLVEEGRADVVCDEYVEGCVWRCELTNGLGEDLQTGDVACVVAGDEREEERDRWW